MRHGRHDASETVNRKSILILCFSYLDRDPRVNRQIRLLAQQHRVTAAGFSDPAVEGVTFIRLPHARPGVLGKVRSVACLLAGLHAGYYWGLPRVRNALPLLEGRTFDLIIANDWDTWELALRIRGRAKVIMDAHEYSPREFDDLLWWRILYSRFRYALCSRVYTAADAQLTVCQGIAEEYARQFSVRPSVVMNVAGYQSLAPSPLDGDRVRMIHHGIASKSRQIENMILMMDHLPPRFTLDLMLVPSSESYLLKLKTLASGRKSVRFIDPVPMRLIPETINKYDLGLYLLSGNCFNNLHSLPNKFFEFIQARLAIAIGPSPEMARIVKEHSLGIVADSFEPRALATAIGAINVEQLGRHKQNAHKAASLLCWEHESQSLLQICDGVLGSSGNTKPRTVH